MGEHYFPERGLGPMPPQDALLYRLYESAYSSIAYSTRC